VINATECAVEIQTIMATRNEEVPESRRMQFRIGINLGDVIHDETRIYGDGINVAARLEGIAEPGGICISRQVFDQVSRALKADFQALGPRTLKDGQLDDSSGVRSRAGEGPHAGPLRRPRQRAVEISFDAFVSDLETVVDAAGITRFALLGISQGCAISIAYAVRHPERVLHLILYGGFALGGTSAPAPWPRRSRMPPC
jgi:hypothetical protein